MPPPDTAWYDDTMRRVSPASSCSGLKTGMATMVVQFGLATMPLGMWCSASALASGTTSGTSGSRRQADELSMTMAPAAARRGASSRETEAGARAEGEVDAGEVGRGGVLHHDVLVPPGQRGPGRAGRSQVPHGGDGEVALEEDRAHDHAHLSGRSDDGDTHVGEFTSYEMVAGPEAAGSSRSGRTVRVRAVGVLRVRGGVRDGTGLVPGTGVTAGSARAAVAEAAAELAPVGRPVSVRQTAASF